VRSSGTASIFVDGVKVRNSNTGTWSVSTFLSQGSLGANSFTTSTDERFTGFLSNFRVLKNQALYTTNFTPPISTLTTTSNTRLLLSSSSVVDSGPNTIPFNANTALPTVGTDVVFQPSFINVTTGVAYSISPSLPTGLSFNVSNGFITGNTAQTIVSNTYTVTVTADGQSNSSSFIMNVVPRMSITTSTQSLFVTLNVNLQTSVNVTPATATGGSATGLTDAAWHFGLQNFEEGFAAKWHPTAAQTCADWSVARLCAWYRSRHCWLQWADCLAASCLQPGVRHCCSGRTLMSFMASSSA
jgi:hypothetical protein